MPFATKQNWAGNVPFAASAHRRPRSLEELQELVASSSGVHALGAGHSFSDVADTPGVLISLEDLPRVLEIDRVARRVRVGAAMRFADLGPALTAEGWALANLASLPHLSVAGACATGTHGSGDSNASLSSLVAGLELIGPDGEIVTLDRESTGGELAGSVVACGALGVVSALSLDLVPSFEVRQNVYDDLPFPQALDHLDELFAAAYSVSLFVDWRRPHVSQIWRKALVTPGGGEPPPEILGARPASEPRHPISRLPPGSTTHQFGVPGAWNDRLPHFRADEAPSVAGDELQSEYLVGRDRAREALERLGRIHERLAPLVQVSELRSVAPDELWLSPFYERSSVAIHFTWVHDLAGVIAMLPDVESELAEFGARPHWGKLFTVAPEQVRELYGRFGDFQALLERRDPSGKFANAFSKRYLSAAG
jgi:xylitol oxidase